ncbi:His-Xaa-Ser system-associated MauG-like protein [Bacterioplanoides sp.]|uniref:His-Xaa-Ser system-associated MauG-like protein n=1 Tax=Bacterioplanoides sp. TaxID=2066072 RepID=UPI003B5ACD05
MKYLLSLMLLGSMQVAALNLDEKLALILDLYALSPKSCSQSGDSSLAAFRDAGDILFNSSVLSGDSDTSCSVCHLDDKHLADGLPIAAGIGRNPELENAITEDTVLVPRNAFTLFGRSDPEYKVFFWDGKVVEKEGQIFSPMGNGYALGFKSPLAVAAVLPLLARDEFLGRHSYFDSTEHFDTINTQHYRAKYDAANKVIASVLKKANSSDAKKLKQAFIKAGVKNPTLADVGNALASFIDELNERCISSAWDEYLKGNTAALTEQQKEGAVLFYGKGRCAGCHSGSLFSDFEYHSLAVPQGNFGTYIHSQDIGRASVTYQDNDRYQFRTPSLIGVSKTEPYGHNGVFPNIDSVVRFHLNPIPFLSGYKWTSERERLTYGKTLNSRSELLGYITIETEEELTALISFLDVL